MLVTEEVFLLTDPHKQLTVHQFDYEVMHLTYKALFTNNVSYPVLL